MRKCDVRTPEQALAYITDCNLATVSSMAMLKSRKKSEYERQISIAQTALTWMMQMGVDMSGTRAEEIQDGDVSKWAAQYDVKADRNEIS